MESLISTPFLPSPPQVTISISFCVHVSSFYGSSARMKSQNYCVSHFPPLCTREGGQLGHTTLRLAFFHFAAHLGFPRCCKGSVSSFVISGGAASHLVSTPEFSRAADRVSFSFLRSLLFSLLLKIVLPFKIYLVLYRFVTNLIPEPLQVTNLL